jgi:hypothetical protein
MKVTSGKDLKLSKGVSVVFNSDSDSDNDEEHTEFEEKGESNNLEDNIVIKDTVHYEEATGVCLHTQCEQCALLYLKLLVPKLLKMVP